MIRERRYFGESDRFQEMTVKLSGWGVFSGELIDLPLTTKSSDYDLSQDDSDRLTMLIKMLPSSSIAVLMDLYIYHQAVDKYGHREAVYRLIDLHKEI